MKKLLLLAAFLAVAVPASRVSAQVAAPETPQPNRTVSVVGAVGQPGSFAFVPDEKAVALLKRAGGMSSVASPSKVYVLRSGVKIPLDLSLSPEMTAKFALHESDVLVVPEALRRISVFGEVARPGAKTLPAERQFSVIDALNAAGGTLSAPDTIRIGVVRASSGPSIEWYYWPEDSKVLASRSLLQEGDTVYVSPSTRRRDSHREGGLQLLPLPLNR